MLNIQSATTTNFFGHDTSEVMPENLTPMAVNPSADVYYVREAMWRQVSTSMDSAYGVLGQPTKVAMNVRRGDLLFTDSAMTGTIDYAQTSTSLPVVFNSLLGLSFPLMRNGVAHSLQHNGSLTIVGGAMLPHADATLALTDMLQVRYNDLRFVGIALSDWTIDDLRQSNAGIAATTSGAIATLNTTGHSVARGTLLCLKMPKWGDQFGGTELDARGNGRHEPNQDGLDPSGATRNWVGRPRLRIYTEPKHPEGLTRLPVLRRIQTALRAIRTAVATAGGIFGGQMEVVRVAVQIKVVAILANADAAGGANAQAGIDSAGAGLAAFGQFEVQWAAVNTEIDGLQQNANLMTDSDLHDAYLCVLAELLRIHQAVWAAVGDPIVVETFFDEGQRFSDDDQAVRRAMLHVRELHAIPGGTMFHARNRPELTPETRLQLLRDAADAESDLAALGDAQVAATTQRTNSRDLAAQVIFDMYALRAAAAALGAGVVAPQLRVTDARQLATTRIDTRLTALVKRLRAANADVGVADLRNAGAAIADAAAVMHTAVDRVQAMANNGDNAARGNAGAGLVFLVAALPRVGPFFAEMAALNTAADDANGILSMANIEAAQERARAARAAANYAWAKKDLPDNTADRELGAGHVGNDATQTAVVQARAADITTLAEILNDPQLFRNNIARLIADADNQLRRLIKPWDMVMRATFARVVGCIRALKGAPYADTAHYDMLFGGRLLSTLLENNAGLRGRVAAQTLARLDFAVDADKDAFLRSWASLERSSRSLARIVDQVDARTMSIITSANLQSQLLLDPAVLAHKDEIDVAVRDAMYLYMIYNNSVHGPGAVAPLDMTPVAPRYADYFELWAGKAGLSPPRSVWPTNYENKRWHELPLFKAVEAAQPGALMRVTIIT